MSSREASAGRRTSTSTTRSSSTTRCRPCGARFGNIVFFPGGTAGKRMPFYLTGGIGVVMLSPRVPTKVLGYDVDVVGTQSFISENIGGGIKIFRGGRCAQLGLPPRLPLPLREREQRRAGLLRQIEEPRRASHLRRNAVYLEEIVVRVTVHVDDGKRKTADG